MPFENPFLEYRTSCKKLAVRRGECFNGNSPETEPAKKAVVRGARPGPVGFGAQARSMSFCGHNILKLPYTGR